MIKKTEWGTLRVGPYAGTRVNLYTLSSPEIPFTLTVSDYGAVIYAAVLTDSDGVGHPLVRGYDTLDFYERAPGYLGAVVGRVGNRIARGKFTLEGKNYSLFINNGPNHLHGGRFGFNFKVYQAEYSPEGLSILLRAVSPDGDEGYPGTLTYSVRYTLSAEVGFTIEYEARTDAPTPVNLTNHSYFNLDGKGTVDGYLLELDADRYLPTDETLIPTGVFAPVEGTVFDFRKAAPVGAAATSDHKDIRIGGGIDHCFVFPTGKTGYRRRARLYSPASGIRMSYYTDLPAVQVYSGNYLTETDFPFRGGEPEQERAAICFESENFPDSVNHPSFTDVILRPGQVFSSKTGYFFDFSSL